jgi:hypothetical protein
VVALVDAREDPADGDAGGGERRVVRAVVDVDPGRGGAGAERAPERRLDPPVVVVDGVLAAHGADHVEVDVGADAAALGAAEPVDVDL